MYSWDNAQVVLVGNKCDLEQDRAVTQERGQRLADQLGNSLRLVCGCTLLVFVLLLLLLLLSTATCETGYLLGDHYLPLYMLSRMCSYCCCFKGSADKHTFVGENPSDTDWE